MPSKASTTVDRTFTAAGRRICALAVFVLLPLSACNNQLNNPWKDSSEVVDADMTTTNAEIYEKSPSSPPRTRGETPAQFTYATGETTHWPEWFSDPFNDTGNDSTTPGDRDVIDTKFAVNSVDYLHIAYGPARLLLNVAGFPASAIVDWPGKLQASDGRLSKQTFGRMDHDYRNVKPGEIDPPDVVTIHEPPSVDPAANQPAPLAPVGQPAPHSPNNQPEPLMPN